MVCLRSSCYRFLWGIVARNPFACAKLARTLREPCAKFRMCEIVKGQNYTQQLPPWPITIQKSMTSIQSLVCLNWLYLCKPEGRHTKQTMQQGKQRNSSPISSRPIMLCNPVRCIFIHFCFNYLRDFGLARTWACAKLVKSLRARGAIHFLKQ